MSSLSSEAAKNPCVPLEQNGLVARECLVSERIVRTGLQFSIPKIKLESLSKKIVYMIGNPSVTVNCVINLHKTQNNKQSIHTVTDSLLEKLETIKKDIDEFKGDITLWCFLNSILDLPAEYRSKGIVICFDESSYSGRQSLFHQFGSGINALSQENSAKIGSKPYQAFVELMEKVQESGDAIVFVPKALQNETLKEVMWCPPKLEETKKVPERCPTIPQKELDKVYWKPDVIVQVGIGAVYPVEKLPSLLKDWISSEFPGTTYVNFGPSVGSSKGMLFGIWGWNELPKKYSEENIRWRSTFETVFETNSSFKEFIDIAVENAKACKNIYTKEIAYTILKMANPPSTILFDAPLVDTTQRGYRRISSNELKEETLYRDCDVLVGFIADTDATFDLVLDNDGVWDSPVLTVFPFRMKAGEFCLAWRDKGILPSIRLVYHHMWVQNLQGSVRRVGMLIGDTDERRKFVQADEFPLDSDGWVSSCGMIGKKK